MTPYVAPRNPGLSVLLSFLWAGLGQIYNGQPLIGVPLAAVVAGVGFLDYRILQKVEWVGWSSAPSEVQLFFQGSLAGLAIIWLWSMWYAHHVATRINAGVSVSASPPAARAIVTASPSASVGTTGDPGEDTWRLIETSRDKAMLEEFAAKFPDHPRAMMARILLQRIEVGTNPAVELSAAPESVVVEARVEKPTPFYWGRALVAAGAVVFAFIGFQIYTGQLRLPDFARADRSPPETREPPPRSADIQLPPPPYIAPPSQGVLFEGTPLPGQYEVPKVGEWATPPAQIPAVVLPVVKPTMTLDLRARPYSISAGGEQTTVTWTSTNADNCTLEGPSGYRRDTRNGSVSGSSEIPARLHFRFTCWQDGKMAYTTTVVDAR